MFVNDFKVGISMTKFKENERYKKKTLKTIMDHGCALFNSGGGKVTLSFQEMCTREDQDNFLRIIEQRLRDLTSTATVSNITVVKSFQQIVMITKASDHLITMNYNIYLPDECEVISLPPSEPIENVKKIVQGKPNQINRTPIRSHCKDFVLGKDVGFVESKNNQQKCIKVMPSKQVTVAMRMCGKSNKLARYISAFANHSGGHVYYGIEKNGIVSGERLTNKNKDEIVKEVAKLVSKMVWPDHVNGPKKGEHWDVFFESVKDKENREILSVFVIVVFVAQCPGGVFTEEPESYKVVNRSVERIDFPEWLSHFKNNSNSVATQVSFAFPNTGETMDSLKQRSSDKSRCEKEMPDLVEEEGAQNPTGNAHDIAPKNVIAGHKKYNFQKVEEFRVDPDSYYLVDGEKGRLSWSSRFQLTAGSGPSGESEKVRYLRDLEKGLIRCRNNHDMKKFSDLCKKAIDQYPERYTRFIVKCEEVTDAYKKHNFRKAEDLLNELELYRREGPDRDIDELEVRVMYERSCLQSLKGNYKDSLIIAQEGLTKMKSVQAGIITVWFYMHAAMLKIILSCTSQSTLGSSTCDSLRKDAQDYLKLATKDAEVLEHSTEESSDLMRKLRIYKACAYLGCSLTGETIDPKLVTREDINAAAKELVAVQNSVTKEHPLSHYRKVQFLLATCDFHCRYKYNSHQDRVEKLKHAFRWATQARTLAREHHFFQMVPYSNKRRAFITEELVRNAVDMSSQKRALR